jgi:hypothetical protein
MTVFCNSCAAPIAAESRFCNSCGAPVAASPIRPGINASLSAMHVQRTSATGGSLKETKDSTSILRGMDVNNLTSRQAWLIVAGIVAFLVICGVLTDTSKPTTFGGLTYDTATFQCSEQVKRQLHYPASFEDVWKPGNSVFRNKFPENGLVRITFSAKNSFGMPIEGQAHCMGDSNGKVTLIAILNEDGTGALLP